MWHTIRVNGALAANDCMMTAQGALAPMTNISPVGNNTTERRMGQEREMRHDPILTRVRIEHIARKRAQRTDAKGEGKGDSNRSDNTREQSSGSNWNND